MDSKKVSEKTAAEKSWAEMSREERVSLVGGLAIMAVLLAVGGYFVYWLFFSGPDSVPERAGGARSSEAASAASAASVSADALRAERRARREAQEREEERGDPTMAAGLVCDDAVERLAQYASRWTDGFLEPKFSRYRWQDGGRRVAVVFGDTIEFQNGFGAWQPHLYSCTLDMSKSPPEVLDVEAAPGRLPPL